MIATYEDYSSQPGSLPFEEMAALHRDMAAEIGRDADSLSLYQDLLTTATKYADYRAHWTLWGREEKAENDSYRTSAHNSAIDSLNILARCLRAQGKAAAWRDRLGDDRRRIGDFACYLVFVESLNAR